MENFATSRSIVPQELPAEERSIRRGDFDMRLMIRRSHAHARFMDYRSGSYEQKCELLDQLARQEGLRKIFTLVEKQDSNSWRGVGFVREGVCPTFFRMADAYVVSRCYDAHGRPVAVTPLKASSDERSRFSARRLRRPDGLTISPVEDERSRGALLHQAGGLLWPLPFGRVRAPDLALVAKARGNRRAIVCAEAEDSFGHALLGFSPAPGDEANMTLCAYAGRMMLQRLAERECASIFCISPMSDRWSNELLYGLGFKVTGRLHGHLPADDAPQHALLWHQRIGAPPQQHGAEAPSK